MDRARSAGAKQRGIEYWKKFLTVGIILRELFRSLCSLIDFSPLSLLHRADPPFVFPVVLQARYLYSLSRVINPLNTYFPRKICYSRKDIISQLLSSFPNFIFFHLSLSKYIFIWTFILPLDECSNSYWWKYKIIIFYSWASTGNDIDCTEIKKSE